MNSLQQPKLKKSHIVGISFTLLVIGIGIWLGIAAWKKTWPFNKKDEDKTCTPDPDETVIGAVTYITNDDGDCIANTCNTTVGYDLTAVDGACIISDKFNKVNPPKKCIYVTSNVDPSEAYCDLEHWYKADTTTNMNVCKDQISTRCNRLKSDCKTTESHSFCGTTDEVNCDTVYPTECTK